MSDIAAYASGRVARPLAVLVPLIKKDLEEARDASERASMPYYRSAGEKMIEAKKGGDLKHGEFVGWIERNFKIGIRQAQFYMNYAKTDKEDEKRSAVHFSSLNDFVRQTSNPDHGRTVHRRPWHADVKESIEQAKREAEQARNTRQQEHQAYQKLALRLIEIGFKVLAKELHPDRGGSREAMSRLNRVRDHLKKAASSFVGG